MDTGQVMGQSAADEMARSLGVVVGPGVGVGVGVGVDGPSHW